MPLRLSSGLAHDQGVRSSMEDESVAVDSLTGGDGGGGGGDGGSFYAVYDGHAGAEAAKWCCEHLHPLLVGDASYPEDVPRALAAAFRASDRSVCTSYATAGTTAAVALVRGTRLTMAWVGDTRVVVGGADASVRHETRDHKPGDAAEKRRIEAAGGKVNGGMVNGTLAVARAIGDAPFKYAWGEKDGGSDDEDTGNDEEDSGGDQDEGGSSSSSGSPPPPAFPGISDPFQLSPSGGPDFPWREGKAQVVSSEPEVREVDLTPEDAFVVVACDGLFDVMPSAKVVEEAAKCVKKGMSADKVAKELVELALDYETVDNVSVVFVRLLWE